MSVPTFGKPAATTEGDQYTVADHAGHLLIIKPVGYNPSRPTKNTPEGTPCVTVDLVDLDDETGTYIYRNVPLFGGALVDATKPALDSGEVLVASIRLQWNKNNSRQYPVLDGVDDTSRAAQWYAVKGDPFAPTFAPTFAAPAQQPQQQPQQQAPNYGAGQQGDPWATQRPQSGSGNPY